MSDEVAARLATVKNRGTLRIVTRGRRTGRPHGKLVWFAVDGPRIYLGTLNAKRDWVRNAQKNPDVELEIGPLRVRGRVATITDPALQKHAAGLIAGKYWAAWLGSLFGFGPDATFRVDELTPVAG